MKASSMIAIAIKRLQAAAAGAMDLGWHADNRTAADAFPKGAVYDR
jgi:hypothetical protein